MGSKCCRIALWAEHAVGCLGWTVHQAGRPMAAAIRPRGFVTGTSADDGRSFLAEPSCCPGLPCAVDDRQENGPAVDQWPPNHADQCRVQQRFRATRGGFPRPSGVMADLASKRSTAAAVFVSMVQQPPTLTRGRRSVEAGVGKQKRGARQLRRLLRWPSRDKKSSASPFHLQPSATTSGATNAGSPRMVRQPYPCQFPGPRDSGCAFLERRLPNACAPACTHTFLRQPLSRHHPLQHRDTRTQAGRRSKHVQIKNAGQRASRKHLKKP